MRKIAVLGGGASGIIAAIAAKRSGAKVILLEKNSRIGKKLLMTGNGRCNFTNADLTAEDYNSGFAADALKAFSPSDTMRFFREIGMLSRIEAEGRVYPVSGQAATVLEILLLELERLGVETVCDFDVTGISAEKDGFKVISRSGAEIFADKVIASFGGKAAPKTGSDGSGYDILKRLGHSCTAPQKSLVQLKTDKKIKGVRAFAEVSVNGIKCKGEVQFAEYGLSGIPIFNISKYAKEGDIVFLDLMPDMSIDEIKKYLKKRYDQRLETYLIGVLNKQLGQVLLKECDLGRLSRRSSSLSEREISMIANKIKGWRFTVTGKMPWDNAQVTAGGIKTEEICPKTMESRIVKGLYITGELLDIDAPCGGYNLQWAWSSGMLAGRNAAEDSI